MYNEEQLQNLINEVETEFKEEITKAEAMKKSENAQTNQNEETIEDLYKSMDKEERAAHYEALKSVVYGDQDESMNKSENSEEVEKLKADHEELMAKNEKLEKSVADLVSALKSRVSGSAPKQQAVTNMDYIKKSEESNTEEDNKFEGMSKKEINAILNKKIRNGEFANDLEKKERVMDFVLARETNIDKIKDLL